MEFHTVREISSSGEGEEVEVVGMLIQVGGEARMRIPHHKVHWPYTICTS